MKLDPGEVARVEPHGIFVGGVVAFFVTHRSISFYPDGREGAFVDRGCTIVFIYLRHCKIMIRNLLVLLLLASSARAEQSALFDRWIAAAGGRQRLEAVEAIHRLDAIDEDGMPGVREEWTTSGFSDASGSPTRAMRRLPCQETTIRR
jgi:hypothetical protein